MTRFRLLITLQWLLFLIPLNIYESLGLAAGIQWAVFRYQTSYLGNSPILLNRDLSYIQTGILTGKSAIPIILWSTGAILLVIALLLTIFAFLKKDPAILKKSAALIIAGGLLFLFAMFVRYGPLLHNEYGFSIPFGVPLVFFTGWCVYCGFKEGKKEEGIVYQENLWETAYIILCITLIAFTIFQILWTFTGAFGLFGWDYRVFVGGIQSLDHMQNPYILENINRYAGGDTGGNLQFDAPPHTLYFFWLLDFFFVFHNIGIYYVLLFILLMISGYLIVTIHCDDESKPHYLFLTTLLLTGFMATYWNFVTGNKDILFLFLFALIFVLLLKEKYWQSSIVMGLAAAVSLTTTPFVVLYLVVKRSILNCLSYILLFFGVVAALFLVSYCISPIYLASYIGILLGSTSPLYDPGGLNTPTPYLMLKDLLKAIHFGDMLPVAIVSCVYISLILYATWNFSVKNRENTIKIYSLVMLAVFMLLPRIKPYDFIILVVPLYFLFKDCSYRIKSLVFVVISLPLFVWLLFPLIGPTSNLPFMLGLYPQTYSLILIFIVIILHNYLTPASHPKGNNR